MTEEYFGINYIFDRKNIFDQIDLQLKSNQSAYICVSDGVHLATKEVDPHFAKVLNNALFSVCDSGLVPLYIRWIWGRKRQQTSGTDLFRLILEEKKYRLCFIGSSYRTLEMLKAKLRSFGNIYDQSLYLPLPYCTVEKFDYKSIAQDIEKCTPDIIFVSLGAPKQEFFSARLTQELGHTSIVLPIGAAFNFYANPYSEKRAPEWMIQTKLEWLFRLFQNPSKQVSRISRILRTLPRQLWHEYHKKLSIPQS